MKFLHCFLLSSGFALGFYSTHLYAETSKHPACLKSTPVIQLGKVVVCGTQQIKYGKTAYAYLGIPYATPPIGSLRWHPPETNFIWKAKRYRATHISKECTQPTVKGFSGSEDCLYLNVWRPVSKSKKLKAVMVFIPGGGFLIGQGGLPGYNGTYMASTQDVIIVTMNYRLGPLGFLRYKGNNANINGNFAIQDQLAALKWVQKNIKQFGGDPKKVTIFGESAGANSVALHLFSVPASKKLFRAAIMESNVASMLYASPQKAQHQGAKFVALLCQLDGKSEKTCPKTAKWLRKLPTSMIIKAEDKMMPPGGMPGLLLNGITQGALWGPVVGIYPVVGQAVSGYQPGMVPKPFVIGFNRNEGTFFMPEPGKFTNKNYFSTLVEDFGMKMAKKIYFFTVNHKQPYNPTSYKYDPNSGMTPAAQAMAKVITDYGVATASLAAMQHAMQAMHSSGNQMHFYFFDQVSTFNYAGFQRCSPASKNICHTEELPYVFHNFVKREGIQSYDVPMSAVTKHENALASRMDRSWASFAKDPKHWKSAWGYPPVKSLNHGPYLKWGEPIEMISNVNKIVNYDLWIAALNQRVANSAHGQVK